MLDARGNDLAEVDFPIAAQTWIGPNTVPVMDKTELEADPLVIPQDLDSIGLLTTDGGPEWGVDGQGEAIEFFDEGYQLPGDGGWYTLSVTAAQNQPLVDELIVGVAYTDGYREVGQTSNPNVYTCFAQIAYKSGKIVRRMSNNVMVEEGKKDKAERGKAHSTPLKFKWLMMSNKKYFSEVVIAP